MYEIGIGVVSRITFVVLVGFWIGLQYELCCVVLDWIAGHLLYFIFRGGI